MGAVNIFEIEHEFFGKCLKIENKIAEIIVTLDFGPRIIHYSLVDKPNMFFEDREKKPLGENLGVFGDETLKLCGGHRLWIAPEILPRCYYPDSVPVQYKILESSVEFTAPVEKLNNIQKILSVSMWEDSSYVSVGHTIKNCGTWEIELAPWAITMMAPGGKEIVPLPPAVDGLLPNKFLTLWGYSNMNDPRVHWGDEFITLTHSAEIERPFKVGLNNDCGWAALFNHEQLFLKFFEPVADGLYPDNGCSYETYTNSAMTEMESLGELTIVEPGGSITHTEEWELYHEPSIPDDNSASIKNLISKYI